MKKILLGTSALIGVVAAGPVFAQNAGGEPIKLSIGGHWLGAYGDDISQNGAAATRNVRRDDLLFDNVIQFNGSTKLDNGLTVGTVFQLRAQNLPNNKGATPGFPATGSGTDDRIKRQWVSFSGGFGDVRIGDQDDARRQKGVVEPVPGGGNLFGANSPQFGFDPQALTNTTVRSISTTSRASRIAYLSPTIAGFSVAATYAPGGEKGGNEFASGVGPSADQNPASGNVVNNEWSIAGAYSGKFGDLSINGAAGVSQGHRITNNATTTGHFNPMAADGGLVLGWGPVQIGGAYEYVNDPAAVAIGQQHKNNSTWGLGAIYEVGPFGVGIDWTRGIYQGNANNIGARLDYISLSTDYKLGPGIQVGVGLNYTHFKTDQALASNPDFNSLGIVFATGLFF